MSVSFTLNSKLVNIYKLNNRKFYLKEIIKYFSNSYKSKFANGVLRRLRKIEELRQKSSKEKEEIYLNDVY